RRHLVFALPALALPAVITRPAAIRTPLVLPAAGSPQTLLIAEHHRRNEFGQIRQRQPVLPVGAEFVVHRDAAEDDVAHDESARIWSPDQLAAAHVPDIGART